MSNILTEADKLVNGERAESYGSPRKSFDTVARLWQPILGVSITAEQVALCMIQLKIARELNKHKTDNLVDIAGYAQCLEKCYD